jgi:hypothetical protein
MESGSLVWGILALLSGVFICAYGNVLFRFVLAVLGFMIGFSLVMWLGGGLGQPMQIIVAIVVGGALAAVAYMLFKLALYFAGAILGITIVFAILGLVGVTGSDLGAFGWVLALAGAVLGGIFGRRLGDLAIVFATALAGAYLVVLGLARVFVSSIDSSSPITMLGVGFPLLLFLTVALISGLTQYEVLRIRRRFLR